jgi:hypothetical protein
VINFCHGKQHFESRSPTFFGENIFLNHDIDPRFDPETFYRYTFPFFTGGVTLTEDFTIDKLSKVALNYFLKSQSKEDVLL